MNFKNKNILIISQQDWGEMFISKHHYAVELAKMDNKVYFINSPDKKGRLAKGEIRIEPTEYKKLSVVRHSFFFPYVIKFKARFLFELLVRLHIKKLVKKIGKPIDIVWSFDLSNTIPLKYFPAASMKIFMAADHSEDRMAIKAAVSSKLILATSKEILEKYDVFKVQKYVIGHGVSPMFFNENGGQETNGVIKVGLAGNFLRPDIDRGTLLKVIKSNPQVSFNFWGSVDYATANLASVKEAEAVSFVDELHKLPNVKLHGQVSPDKLVPALRTVNCFLICYDINNSQVKGENYHKILEYLATGTVTISNNIAAYQQHPGLIEMIESRVNNDQLPELFSRVVENIESYNSMTKRKERVEFAKQFSYRNQVKKVEQLINASA